MFKKTIILIIIAAFADLSLYVPRVQAGEVVVPVMPAPGTRVNLSPAFTPAHLKGITIHPDNALKFDFLIHKGDGNLDDAQKRQEYKKLVKYFLASLTIPDEHQWVNLSPYEKGRIVQTDFGKTEMGRDLLAQDYLLKQMTSSLMYPEFGLGKVFWDKVYARAYKEHGTANVPVNTFNKVWIVPDEALIYESGNTAYVVKNHLKVMLEEDYLALGKNANGGHEPEARRDRFVSPQRQGNHHIALGTQIIREIILPEIAKEVNEGKNFAMLRQIYSGMLLAAWYKKALKESLLGKVYADKAKVKGVDQDPKVNEEIYQKYLAAFKKGVYNYIKEDFDQNTQQIIPRKYFAGGAVNDYARVAVKENVSDPVLRDAMGESLAKGDVATVILTDSGPVNPDAAEIAQSKVRKREFDLNNHQTMNIPHNGYPISLDLAARVLAKAALRLKITRREERYFITDGTSEVELKDGSAGAVLLGRGTKILDLFMNTAGPEYRVGERNISTEHLNIGRMGNTIFLYDGGTTKASIYGTKVTWYEVLSQEEENDLKRQLNQFAGWEKEFYAILAALKVQQGGTFKDVETELKKAGKIIPLVKFVNQYPNLDEDFTARVVSATKAYNEKKDELLKQLNKPKGDGTDNAQLTQIQESPGGIDLNSANLNLSIKRDGKGVPLPFPQQDMAGLSRIQGFEANIVEIRPFTGLSPAPAGKP
ncbi:MAG: hypothetical protein HY591_01310 [Candidatus Omnitrophica bacterium]|nr:hypothetical protein [Candidatus Omnitrophota bacterium]